MTAQEALTAAASPISSATQVYARVALLSVLSAFFLFIALHVLKRDLDPSWHMVSEYAVGRHGWGMTVCFLLLSVSCILSVFAVFPFVHSIAGKVGLLLLVCAGFGLALAAVFPTDPITVSPSEASRSAGLHAISVMIGVPTLTIASLLVSYAVQQQAIWKSMQLPLLGFAHLTWISLVLTIAVVAIWMTKNGGFGPTVLVGGPNRLMFIAYFGWLGTLTWPLAK